MLLLAGTVVAFGVVAGCAKEPEPAGEPTPNPPVASTTTGESTTGGDKATSSTTGEAGGDPGSATTTDGTAGAGTEAPKAPDQSGYQAPSVKDGEEVGVIDTAKGQIIVKFFPEKAPKHVAQFKKLANEKFWDGTRFHRCIPGFMIQGGDPNSKDLSKAGMWGTGGYMKNGKEVNVPAEFNDISHKRGVLSAARSQDPDSASSQFFLMHQDSTFLDGNYSAYGQIVKGIDVVDEIVKTGNAQNNGSIDDPKDAVVVKSIRIAKWPVK